MDDVVLNKISTIRNCLKRIREDYEDHKEEFERNFTRQDAVLLNLQSACEASFDLGIRIVRLKDLGFPQSSREIFQLLEKNALISPDLSERMQRMVGFRNIAVHDYQALNLDVVKSILEERLGDFKEFIEAVNATS